MNPPTRCLALLLLVSLPRAQEILSEAPGSTYEGQGHSLAVAGDVDGDGCEDLWTGRPNPLGLAFLQPSVRLVSGRDGSPLRTVTSLDPAELFGAALASGRDLNGDGTPDVVVGAPLASGSLSGAGRVVALDGAPGASSIPLWERAGAQAQGQFGTALLFLDDLDGDGVAELLVGAPGEDQGTATGAGAIHVLSGASGAPLAVLRGGIASGELGFALAAADDHDGDGRADFLAGAPGAGLDVPRSGLALILSGRSGRILRVIQGQKDGDLFGHALAAAGDADGDGIPDVVVGAPGRSYARLHSGATGKVLFSFRRTSTELPPLGPLGTVASFGAAVLGVGDQDGDGHDDVAVGYPAHSSVSLFSGADGTEIARHAAAHRIPTTNETYSVHFGWALARIDLDADAPPELAVGAPHDADGGAESFAGSVTLLRPAMDPEWRTDVSRLFPAGDVDRDGHDDYLVESVPGELDLVSGRTGASLHRWTGLVFQELVRAGDVDADGVPDLLFGDPTGAGQHGQAFVLSGATGAELRRFAGLQSGDLFGTSVSALGDVNGDGHADVVVGAPRAPLPSRTQTCDLDVGYARVFSGADGSLLRELVGEGLPGWNCSWGPWSEAFGFQVLGVGDWSGDGISEIAVSAPGGGATFQGVVRVFSGSDGSLFRELTGRWTELGVVLSGGPRFDVDADGVPDVLVGYEVVGYGPTSVNEGGAVVLSGADGSRLGEIARSLPTIGYLGSNGPHYAAAALRDFDGDGFSDYAFGNPILTGPMGPSTGEVLVRSGKDGSLLARFAGTSSWDYLGYTVVSLGDLDRDGTEELAFEAWAGETPASFHRWRVLAGTGRGGRVPTAPGPR